MKKNIRLLFILCSLAIAGVIFLQLFWLKNYYSENKDQLQKEMNLALEEALKKEASVRHDSLQQLLYAYVSDTANITISSEWDSNCSSYMHSLINRQNIADRFSFGDNSINFPVTDTHERSLVAGAYARIYRSENLERQSAFFQTRNIGKYIDQLKLQYGFDTASLRFFFNGQLGDRNINQPFVFSFSGKKVSQFPFTTKSFPVSGHHKTIAALFPDPSGYVVRKMGWPIAGSMLLLVIVAIAIFYLLRTILRQKKLSEIKNDFISNITHELKTPIATVSAAIEAMEDFNATSDPVKTKKYLKTSRTEMNRLAGMVDKILDVAIYERQEFDITVSELHADKLISELIHTYGITNGKKIFFRYRNETDCDILKADRVYLYHALNNVIDNAVKYSNGNAEIAVRFFRQNGHAVIEVKDNGPGIAPGNLPYIFEKFYRVPNGNTHRVKGYGLGLFYVKNIMEKHGGWCKVESEPGKGSSFKLGIPHDQ